ncbi:peptidylprolyl isomerase [Sphingorhabdus soli]|uniref:Peptidylprolyl isomerase n=1 Tax=Flavisphingopyxis soli TaxID=2601267 RepID=A0A5C6U7K7_9SPHN|nr:peptidylprolyl isomerase [Sphingorhabdus soli]TXC68784.1 peptidylprolyl isomerase [Sphingorhabdus soli]
MTRTFTLSIAAVLLAGCAALPVTSALAQADPPKPAAPAEAPSPNAIVDAAPGGDWVEIAASDLMVMELAPDAKGKPRRVVIQLMPPPFSQGWIGNMRKLAAAHWWDGTSVNRVQDNYVAQWGDATEKKPLPEGLAVVPESEYTFSTNRYAPITKPGVVERVFGRPIGANDPYAYTAFWSNGWPLAGSREERGWPVHCYGMVGVGRDMSPNTGTGAELYTVIGHAPRHLDRNIALVGRVIDGMEHLSSLPRGHGTLGFYNDDESPTPIVSVRLASDLPATERPRFAYLSTDSDAFAQYADARANRRDPFFIVPAGGADICNIPVPVKAYPWVKPTE